MSNDEQRPPEVPIDPYPEVTPDVIPEYVPDVSPPEAPPVESPDDGVPSIKPIPPEYEPSDPRSPQEGFQHE